MFSLLRTRKKLFAHSVSGKPAGSAVATLNVESCGTEKLLVFSCTASSSTGEIIALYVFMSFLWRTVESNGLFSIDLRESSVARQKDGKLRKIRGNSLCRGPQNTPV